MAAIILRPRKTEEEIEDNVPMIWVLEDIALSKYCRVCDMIRVAY